MTEGVILETLAAALQTAAMISLPLLATAMIVGLLSSALQTATSVQDSNLSFVPRLVCVVAAAFLTAPWALDQLIELATALLSDFTRYTQ